jgi:hypothetical protein
MLSQIVYLALIPALLAAPAVALTRVRWRWLRVLAWAWIGLVAYGFLAQVVMRVLYQ